MATAWFKDCNSVCDTDDVNFTIVANEQERLSQNGIDNGHQTFQEDTQLIYTLIDDTDISNDNSWHAETGAPGGGPTPPGSIIAGHVHTAQPKLLR